MMGVRRLERVDWDKEADSNGRTVGSKPRGVMVRMAQVGWAIPTELVIFLPPRFHGQSHVGTFQIASMVRAVFSSTLDKCHLGTLVMLDRTALGILEG